jgi:hypothetical protein
MSRLKAVYHPLTDMLPFEGEISAPKFAVKDIHEDGWDDDLWVLQCRPDATKLTYHSVVIVDPSAKDGMEGLKAGKSFVGKIIVEEGVPFPVVTL